MRPPTRTTLAKKLKPFVECLAARGWEEAGVFTRYQLALKRSLPDLRIHFNHTYTMTHEELRHAKSYANDTLSHMHTQNKSTAVGHTLTDALAGLKANINEAAGRAGHTQRAFYVAKRSNDRQGLIIEEGTGRNVAVTYDGADAPLLAAAPEMFAALIAAQEDLADLGQLSAETIAMFAPAIRSARNL